MIHGITLLTALILISALALVFPYVSAQTTSVTILSSPSQVQIEPDGTASFDVTAQVSFTGVAQGLATTQAAHWDIVSVVLGYYSSGNTPNSLSGTTSSNPDECTQYYSPVSSVSGTSCVIVPACQFTTTAPTCSGTEDISFQVSLSGAESQQSHFEVSAYIATLEPNQPDQMFNVVSPTASSDFYVNMVNNSSPQYTTPTAAGTVSGTVSISNFQYPTTVLLGQQTIVSFTVSFSGFTPGVTYLIVGVPNADGSNWASGSVVSSSPDNCPEPTEQDRGLAVCFYQPVESQGSENLVFSLTVNSVGTFSSYGAEAEPALRSNSCSSDWCFGQSQYASSFTIQAVTSLPPSSTTPTTGVSGSDATMYFEILMCGLVIIVVGVIAYHVYGSKRKKETVQTKLDSVMVQSQQQPLPIQTPREIVSKDMIFCNQCGARITRHSKVCKECGSKQT